MNQTPAQTHRQTLEALTRLTATIHHIIPAIQELHNQQPGYPTTSGGTGSGVAPTLNDAGKPPGLERHILRPDQATHDLKQIQHLANIINTQTTTLHILTTKWATPTNTTTTGQTKGDDCVACGRFVPGTRDDRIRSGLCNSCRVDHQRSQLERSDWLLQRRHTHNKDEVT